MELRHLRYFVAVAEELHFGRAAERLFIAQPPLSQQIMKFERELGFLLFTRTKRRVELTPAGRLFLDEARDVLAGLEKGIGTARRVASGETGWLRIGFVGSATYQLLPAVLRRFRDEFPEVELTLRELASGRQAQALRDKRIDVGLSRPPIHEPDIAGETILNEPLIAALPSGHRLSHLDRIDLADLAVEPFILFPRSPKPSYADLVAKLCEKAGFLPAVVQEVAEMHTAIGLVTAGLGITLVPECVRNEQRDGVVFKPIKSPEPLTAMAVVYRLQDPSPTVSQFVEIAKAAALGPAAQ